MGRGRGRLATHTLIKIVQRLDFGAVAQFNPRHVNFIVKGAPHAATRAVILAGKRQTELVHDAVVICVQGSHVRSPLADDGLHVHARLTGVFLDKHTRHGDVSYLAGGQDLAIGALLQLVDVGPGLCPGGFANVTFQVFRPINELL